MSTTETTTHYMAVGPYCWGRGTTREEAVRNARQNWPRVHPVKRPADKHFSIYTSDAPITVDGMGAVRTTSATLEKIQTSILATD